VVEVPGAGQLCHYKVFVVEEVVDNSLGHRKPFLACAFEAAARVKGDPEGMSFEWW
jgi:hypothetical protein